MRRVVAFVFCFMMIVGSLSTNAEYGINSNNSCGHDAGEKKYTYSRDLDCCTTVSYSDIYCSFCEEYLRSTPLVYTYSHIWLNEEVVDGKPVKMCLKCDMIQ